VINPDFFVLGEHANDGLTFAHQATATIQNLTWRSLIMAKTLIEPTSTSAEKLRTMLLDKRAAVQQQINELLAQYREHYSTTHNDSVLDLEDRSLRDSTAEQQLSLLESRNHTRVMLDTALRRLDDGEYGLCEDCGADIGPGRLSALPFAKRCLSCQHQAEVLEKIARQEDRRDDR
jgi:DnaK suppressor protein